MGQFPSRHPGWQISITEARMVTRLPIWQVSIIALGPIAHSVTDDRFTPDMGIGVNDRIAVQSHYIRFNVGGSRVHNADSCEHPLFIDAVM